MRAQAHGLKDPQTALNRAPSVVPCEPDLESVERAVLGEAELQGGARRPAYVS